MKRNNINKEYFAPLFEQYIKKTKEVRNCGYWQMPFIPYTFSLYQSAPVKVFFIGRDTYYWCSYEESYTGDPKAYMKANAEYVTINNYKNDWSLSGSFWGMVGKLQLQLMTGKYHSSIEELSEDGWKILESVGYGNLFSIELPETLKKKEEYDDISDWDGYQKLQQLAKPFESLKTIFEAYGEPDVVFVLSWIDKEADFFEGLDYESKAEFYEDGLRAVYLSKTHKTKVIWTSHPRRFPFLSTNPQKMCQYLCDTYKALYREH